MRRFRVFFNVGWCAVDVPAANSAAAMQQVWETLDLLGHGAIEGLSVGSYTVSEQHILDLGQTDESQATLGPLAVARTLRVRARRTPVGTPAVTNPAATPPRAFAGAVGPAPRPPERQRTNGTPSLGR